MKWIIFIIVSIGLYIYFKNRRSAESPQEEAGDPSVNVSVSLDTSSSHTFSNPDTGPITSSNDGGWILNPKSTFPLTVHGIDQSIAEDLKQILENGYSEGMYKVVQNVMPIVTRYNLRCNEVDEYVKKFKPLYLRKIEEQIQASSEWAEASDLDKDDLLEEFKADAIDSLDIRPDCNLDILFEGEQLDVTIDDVLIERFGYDVMRFYLNRKKGVHIIPADHYDRKSFENLVKAGLAIRGEQVHLPAILKRLKLKELSGLVSDLNPPKFTRKAKAIEYLSNVPDIKNRINKIVSFRSLFQIQPLPSEFSDIDLSQISAAWQYANELAHLICGTYYSSAYAMRNQNRDIESSQYDFIKGWVISAVDDNRCCPYCKRKSAKKYPKTQYPVVPLHIGCRCHVSTILRNR